MKTVTNAIELPVRLRPYFMKRVSEVYLKGNIPIDVILSELTAYKREFIITGCFGNDFDAIMGRFAK